MMPTWIKQINNVMQLKSIKANNSIKEPEEYMNWISDLIRHLAISRLFTVAVFIAPATLLFGHYYLPSQIPEIKDTWRLLALATVVFSGTYLVFWLAQWLYGLARLTKNAVAYTFCSGELGAADESLIELIAQQPYECLNLLAINREPEKITRLEYIQQAKLLSKKGFVEISPNDENIISLTERGKRYAVELLAKRRVSANT